MSMIIAANENNLQKIIYSETADEKSSGKVYWVRKTKRTMKHLNYIGFDAAYRNNTTLNKNLNTLFRSVEQLADKLKKQKLREFQIKFSKTVITNVNMYLLNVSDYGETYSFCRSVGVDV